jgi:syntaxin-binding protein 1
VACRTSTSTSGVRLIVLVLLRNNRESLSHITFLAIESQVFSLHVPEYFFSMYSPVRSDATARAERDRLTEDIRFAAKSVCFHSSSFPFFFHSSLTRETRRGVGRGMQIANVCITLNEFPYIRYYVPAHHGPLGALRPHESTRAVARPPENSLRWRTNLARGDQARQFEAADAEVLSRVLAFEVQAALDEYKRANPDFPVRACMRTPKRGGLT